MSRLASVAKQVFQVSRFFLYHEKSALIDAQGIVVLETKSHHEKVESQLESKDGISLQIANSKHLAKLISLMMP